MSISLEGVRTARHENGDAVRTVVGIGVLVVLKDLAEMDDERLKILSVMQKESKPDTGKIAGSRSLVQETIKVHPKTHHPESAVDTLRGAMDEVLNAQGVHEVGHHFRRVHFAERPEIPLLSLPKAAGGLEVVVYDGPEHYAFNPAADKEIDGTPEWIKVTDFLNDPFARDTSLELVRHAATEQMLTRGLRHESSPVFPQRYQFDKAREKRGKLPDITEVVR